MAAPPGRGLILDTSVLVAVLLRDEVHSQVATRLVHLLVEFEWPALALDLAYMEASSALVKAVRSGRIAPGAAAERLRLLSRLPVRFVDGRAFAAAGVAAALESGLSFYDALAPAIARDRGLLFVSADHRQLNAAHPFCQTATIAEACEAIPALRANGDASGV